VTSILLDAIAYREAVVSDAVLAVVEHAAGGDVGGASAYHQVFGLPSYEAECRIPRGADQLVVRRSAPVLLAPWEFTQTDTYPRRRPHRAPPSRWRLCWCLGIRTAILAFTFRRPMPGVHDDEVVPSSTAGQIRGANGRRTSVGDGLLETEGEWTRGAFRGIAAMPAFLAFGERHRTNTRFCRRVVSHAPPGWLRRSGGPINSASLLRVGRGGFDRSSRLADACRSAIGVRTPGVQGHYQHDCHPHHRPRLSPAGRTPGAT
jgi:hypothetical protein